jgi:hypothetical protein
VEQLAPGQLAQQAGETAKTQDTADVPLAPFLFSQKGRDKRSESRLYSGQKETHSINPFTLVLEGDAPIALHAMIAIRREPSRL